MSLFKEGFARLFQSNNLLVCESYCVSHLLVNQIRLVLLCLFPVNAQSKDVLSWLYFAVQSLFLLIQFRPQLTTLVTLSIAEKHSSNPI